MCFFFLLLALVQGQWHILEKTNDVYNMSPDNIHIIDGGKTDTYQKCEAKADAINQTIFTWHDKNQGAYANVCWFRKDLQWVPRNEDGHTTGYKGSLPPTPAPPPSVDGVDCKMRFMAMDFMKKLQPFRAKESFQQLADALNGAREAKCHNVTVPTDVPDEFRPIFAVPNAGSTFYVAVNGKDSNPGTKAAPFATLSKAVDATRKASAKPGTIILRAGSYLLSKVIVLGPGDSDLTVQNYNGEEAWISGAKVIHPSWKKVGDKGIYSADLSGQGITSIKGLHVNGKRAIRARYPNANPIFGFGSHISAKGYLPVHPPTPLVDLYPATPYRNASNSFTRFVLGIGGTCSGFTPPAGYWCGKHTQGGGGAIYKGTPGGIKYDKGLLPNSPYKNATGAVVQMWRPAHWASWMFEVGPFDSGELTFTKGGFQGARGPGAKGGEFYIENVFEELDSANEWFYNEQNKVLYWMYNGTGAIPADTTFEVMNLKNLISMEGTMATPIKNIWFKGVGFKDTMITYLDPHEMPSGGDWGLQRSGAVFMEGTESSGVDSCTFSRLDGNAVMISGYNRNATVTKSEFVWIGDNCIAAWGKTTHPNATIRKLAPGYGWDGTKGTQPRFTQITYNYVHEIGIWEKQSSFYFQAKSCQNHIKGNVFYNGPRAGINFNDGFGGGHEMEYNLMFNTCRESGDHGPFNSWDRQVWVTDIDVRPTIPQWNDVHNNFLIANYQGQEAIDNDDGSAYYHTHDNFFIYSGNGMKNDFGGHDNHHYNNVYTYVGRGLGICSQIAGHEDYFYGNKVIMNKANPALGGYSCSGDAKTVVHDNAIYTSDGKATECGHPAPYTKGTTVGKIPSDDQIIAWGREKLGL